MKIWINYQDRRAYSFEEAASILEDIARDCDVSIDPAKDGLAVSTRLYLTADKRWQRTAAGFGSYSERLGRNHLVHAVCWHGHYRFMSEVFSRFPDARIMTSFADYRGLEDFDNKAESTGDTNTGSLYYPTAARDACLCSERGDDGDCAYDALRFSLA